METLQRHDHRAVHQGRHRKVASITIPIIHTSVHPCIDHNRTSLNNAYRLLFWPWLMYFSAGDAVALFRWTVMLLKALSQRIDQGRMGWQTGGGHARERASRPSSVLWRAARFLASTVGLTLYSWLLKDTYSKLMVNMVSRLDTCVMWIKKTNKQHSNQQCSPWNM